MYKGKEVCQGCKRSGVESTRTEKDDLCYDCKPLLRKGEALKFEEGVEYIMVQDWVNGHSKMEWGDSSLDFLANRLLEALHNKSASPKGRFSFSRYQHNGQVSYNIPEGVVEPLNNFLKGLDARVKKIKEAIESAEVNAKFAVSDERTKIFNEGVDKGRELLFQLNSGEITMNDFEKNLNYVRN